MKEARKKSGGRVAAGSAGSYSPSTLSAEVTLWVAYAIGSGQCGGQGRAAVVKTEEPKCRQVSESKESQCQHDLCTRHLSPLSLG